jgi:hypothetical protein
MWFSECESNSSVQLITDSDYWIVGDSGCDLSSTRVHCEARVAVTEERGKFGYPEERKSSPLESVTRGLMKRQPTKKTAHVL